MTQTRKNITASQFRQALADIKDATGASIGVAEISDSTGLSKAYISEFRNDTRNLTAAQQAQLAAFIEKKCDDAGIDFPVDEASPAGDDAQLKRLLALALGAMSKPSLPLSEDIPEDKRNQIIEQIRTNDARVAQLMAIELESGGLFSGAKFSEKSDAHIRELFGLLATNYIGVAFITGNNLLQRIERENPDLNPSTVGHLLDDFMRKSELAAHVIPASTTKQTAEIAGGDDE